MILSILAGLDKEIPGPCVGDDVRPTDRVVGTMGPRMQALASVVERQVDITKTKYREATSVATAIRGAAQASEEVIERRNRLLTEANNSEERLALLATILGVEIHEEFDLKPDEEFAIRTNWVVVAVDAKEGFRSGSQPVEQPDPTSATNPRNVHFQGFDIGTFHRKGEA